MSETAQAFALTNGSAFCDVSGIQFVPVVLVDELEHYLDSFSVLDEFFAWAATGRREIALQKDDQFR